MKMGLKGDKELTNKMSEFIKTGIIRSDIMKLFILARHIVFYKLTDKTLY